MLIVNIARDSAKTLIFLNVNKEFRNLGECKCIKIKFIDRRIPQHD